MSQKDPTSSHPQNKPIYHFELDYDLMKFLQNILLEMKDDQTKRVVITDPRFGQKLELLCWLWDCGWCTEKGFGISFDFKVRQVSGLDPFIRIRKYIIG
jgi:hypothetical protein